MLFTYVHAFCVEPFSGAVEHRISSSACRGGSGAGAGGRRAEGLISTAEQEGHKENGNKMMRGCNSMPPTGFFVLVPFFCPARNSNYNYNYPFV